MSLLAHVVSAVTPKPFGLKTMDFIVSEDTWVESEPPNNAINWDGLNLLIIGQGDTGAPFSWWRRIWLKFDVSALSSVVEAKLWLYFYNRFGSGTYTVYGMKCADNSWLEGTLTWLTQPALGAEADSFSFAGSVPYEWREMGSYAAYVNERLAIDGIITIVLKIAEDGFPGIRWTPNFRAKDDAVLKPYLRCRYI